MSIAIYMDEEEQGEFDATTQLYNLLEEENFETELFFDGDLKGVKNNDIIFYRFNPPIKEEFLTECEKYEDERLFINKPSSIKKYYKKSYLEKFPNLIPPTIFSDDKKKIESFCEEYQDIVLKPIDQFGGKGVKRFKTQDGYEEMIGDYFSQQVEGKENSENNEVVAQKYIPEVEEGVKRVSVINYDINEKATRLIPGGEEFKFGYTKDDKIIKDCVTKKDKEIVERVLPFLKDNEIYWAGIDIINNYLGEINITSPGISLSKCTDYKNYSVLEKIVNSLQKEELKNKKVI